MSLRAALVTLCACAACGDNRHLPIDAPPPSPDLAVVATEMTGSELVLNSTFGPTDCEVVEGCVGDVGTRRLLAFNAVTANIGTADLDLGPVPPAGVSSAIFEWSPCHMHHHVIGYATFELRDASDAIVLVGDKKAFCLEDDQQITPGAQKHFSCVLQGITVGWADVYARDLPCQWIDVTGVPSGTYTLRVEIDPNAMFPDSNRANNVWEDTVAL